MSSLVWLLRLYVEMAVLLAVGWTLFAAAWAWSSRGRGWTSPRRWRDAALVVIAAAILLPLGTRLVAREGVRRPVRAAGGAPGIRLAVPAPSGPVRSTLGVPAYTFRYTSSQQRAAAGILLLMAAGTAASLALHARRRRALRALLSSLPIVRRLGRVTIAASDVAATPYAARARGRAWIVIPTDLLEDAAALRLLAAHEMQHHRQRDLQVLEAMELLRAAFFWNPAVVAWTRVVEELQELACDAAVVGGRRADVRVYGELLLRAARLEGRERFVPRGASAAGGGSSRVLKRRIAMMMTRGEGHGRGGLVVGVVCVALLAGAALGARSAVLEKKLETRDVAVLAEKVGARGLVVAVNDVVLGEVNRWLATSKDRVFLRESRQRLEERRAMVEAAFARHRVPSALAAVAVVESGFRPLEQKTGFRAAGVWQFIPDTARVFGLKVDAETDERLNLEKETDAAARYLAALHQQLGDWPLALAGYSEGGRKVATVVQEAQTRDAWELIRTGKLGRYPATVVAAALVLEDARLLEGAAD